MGIIDGVSHKNDQFSMSQDITIPPTQAGNPAMLPFDPFDKQLQIIVGSRNQRVVIASKQPSQNPWFYFFKLSTKD